MAFIEPPALITTEGTDKGEIRTNGHGRSIEQFPCANHAGREQPPRYLFSHTQYPAHKDRAHRPEKLGISIVFRPQAGPVIVRLAVDVPTAEEYHTAWRCAGKCS